MSRTASVPARRSLSDHVLRAVILGTLSMLAFYLKILGGILRIGIRAIRGVPLRKPRT